MYPQQKNKIMKKRCTVCKEKKLLVEFFNNKNANDGKSWSCKVCAREAASTYINKSVQYEKRLNMIEVYKYDMHNNLAGAYENVLEAVLYNKGISSTDIYKVCLGRTGELQGSNWSFNQFLPQHLVDSINDWIEVNM